MYQPMQAHNNNKPFTRSSHFPSISILDPSNLFSTFARSKPPSLLNNYFSTLIGHLDSHWAPPTTAQMVFSCSCLLYWTQSMVPGDSRLPSPLCPSSQHCPECHEGLGIKYRAWRISWNSQS